MKSGPIILVEDDNDDKDVFQDILKDLQVPNPVIWFHNCDDAFSYLKRLLNNPLLFFVM